MKLGLVTTTTRFLLCLKLLFNRKNPSVSFIEIIKTSPMKISKVIFRKSYRAVRARMMHLTTISPLALISMLQKRRRFFGGNGKPHINKNLMWAIMNRSKLKDKSNEAKQNS